VKIQVKKYKIQKLFYVLLWRNCQHNKMTALLILSLKIWT